MRHSLLFRGVIVLFLGVSTGISDAQIPDAKGGWHIVLRDEELARQPVNGWTQTHTPSGETRSQGLLSGLGELCLINEDGVTSFPMRLFGNGFTGLINFSAAPLFSNGSSDSDLLIVGQRATGVAPDFAAIVLDHDLKRILSQALITAPPGEPTGMSVVLDDIFGDATPEIVFGSAPGVPGRIYVADINRDNPITFFAFEPTFTGGVRVATGDLNGDGIPEIIAATGAGAATPGAVAPTPGTVTRLRAFEVVPGSEPRQVGDGYPLGMTFTGGMFVSAFDTNGDRIDEIFVGQGTGAPLVRVFNVAGPTPTMIGNFLAFPNTTGGVRVSAGFVKGYPSVATTSGSSIATYQYTSEGDWRRQFGLPPEPFAPATLDEADLQLFLRAVRRHR